MRKMKGGIRFDISLGEVKGTVSHIQLHKCGNCRDSGLPGTISEKRKEGQTVHEPGPKTQKSIVSVAPSAVCCSALMADGVLLQDQYPLRSKQLKEKETEQSSQISVTFCSRSIMPQSYYRQCKETALKL